MVGAIMDFDYTYIPVNPDDKTPALSAGFTYERMAYGDDLRGTDLRQAGHVTSRSAKLFVIDVDDLAAFLDTHLGRFLMDRDFPSLITYSSAADPNKKHLYFIDPDGMLDDEEW